MVVGREQDLAVALHPLDNEIEALCKKFKQHKEGKLNKPSDSAL